MKRLRFTFSLVRTAGFLLSTSVFTSLFAAESASNYRAALESIDTGQIRGIITYLADDAFEGRESGTRGNREAADFIANYFQQLGLEPGGDNGSYFQDFSPNYRNILAILPGSDPELSKEFVIIGAHYDHVGYGNRRNSAGPVGQIHNGADDNASGVSAIMEMAEAMEMLRPRPKRTLIFVAWDAEEMGMLGSRHWVAHPTVPVDKVVLYVNIDMIGRLREDRLAVHGIRSGLGLRRLLVRSNEESALHLDYAWGIIPVADHYPFFGAGVPVLMFHSGQHEHYHTPYDDAELVNMDGVRRISRLLAALVTNAASADHAPAYRAEASKERQDARARLQAYQQDKPPRLGVRWRPANPGEGVLVEGVNNDSPAASSGLRRGDRIVRIAGRPIREADDFPGAVATAVNPVTIEVYRDGSESPVELTAELGGTPVRLGITWNEDDAEPGTLILTNVIPGTLAARADLKRLDRILTLDGARFESADEFVSRLSATHASAEVEIERDGRLQTKTIRFDEGESREEI